MSYFKPHFFKLKKKILGNCVKVIESASKKKGYKNIFDFLINNDPRLDLKLMMDLENKLLPILKTKDLNIVSIQFPFNLRCHYAGKKKIISNYPTSNIHADVWSGAPVDSSNFLIYLHADKGSPTTKFYLKKINKEIISYRGRYINAPISKEYINGPNVEIKNTGDAVFFSTFQLHQTIEAKSNSAMRISIDFRVKLFNPYFNYNNSAVSLKNFIDKNILGDPGYGHYWVLEHGCKNVEDRIKFELNYAKKIGSWAKTLRLRYLETSRFHKKF
jgi:hypothetical protein